MDTLQTEFNTAKKIGGEKTHTLSMTEMPAQIVGGGANKKDWAAGAWGDFSSYAYPYTTVDDSNNQITKGKCSQPHNNLQPYFTCYIWERIA